MSARWLVPVTLVATLVPPAVLAQTGVKKEMVRCGYELLLTRCRGTSCQTASVAKAQLDFQLEEEDQFFAWDYAGAEVRTGDYTYYLRFKASRRSKGNAVERALEIGLSGRLETPSENQQVTWGNKIVTAATWEGFPAVTVPGEKYSSGDDTMQPVLQVSVLPEKTAKSTAP